MPLRADRAALVEGEAVIDRWNRRPATGRDMLWSPTIRAALVAGTPWLDVFCPGCGTSRAIDLRTVERHPLASVGTLLELREEYRAGRVKLFEREPDAEVRARLNAVNGKMLAAIEAELEKRTSAQ